MEPATPLPTTYALGEKVNHYQLVAGSVELRLEVVEVAAARRVRMRANSDTYGSETYLTSVWPIISIFSWIFK